MSRNYKTEMEITCDRCGKQEGFIAETQAEKSLEWKQLSTDMFLFIGFPHSKTFDLCPQCFSVFETHFIRLFPKSFTEAFDER